MSLVSVTDRRSQYYLHTTQISGDCKNKQNYTLCKICTEALPKKLYEHHKKAKECIAPAKNTVRCPLCHQDVENIVDDGWKVHLLNFKQCPGNERHHIQ